MNISHSTFEEVKGIVRNWQKEIQSSRQKEEKAFHEMMLKMLKEPKNKIFLIELLDQSFRSNNTNRVVDQIEYIFEKYETTEFFSIFEQILIWLFRELGIYLSSVSVPLFIQYLRDDISNIVIKGEENLLSRHIQARRTEGTRVNINVIGELVLSEYEAQQREEKYISILENPDIDYLSIKISNLFSQFVPHAHENNVTKVCERVEKIYEAAKKNTFTNKEGKKEYKFVNLDMEEYRDIEITVDVFKRVLSQERFKDLYAGIVVQHYLPDALGLLKELTEFAKKRLEEGGAAIKIRIVKGANQEMEFTEASLRDWPVVTFTKKEETDANFKLALDYLVSPDVAPYVHVGVASHNLFDHALAMLLAKERGVQRYVSAEMLEGMSEAAYRVLKREGLDVILYAPTATKETFTNAIAYLVRRFDENTAQQNFLRHSFGLEVDSPQWYALVDGYENSITMMSQLKLEPRRVQNRNEKIQKEVHDPKRYQFKNESDTDFTLAENRKWAEAIKEKWQNIHQVGGIKAHPVIAGKYCTNSSNNIDVIDKSQYETKIQVGSFTYANADEMNLAIETAKEDPDGWRQLTHHERQKVLMDVAYEVRKARGDLIGIAAAEVGKVFTETDVEVSEAIDFLNFYPYSVDKLSSLEGVSASPKGVGLVISPWNFPIAIPTGGIAASLASGNTVIFKPASDAVLSAYMLCECFWRAGVSKNTLQFVPATGLDVSNHMIPNKDIDFTIFTGGEKSAYEIIKARTDIHLSAETGGKDATIVTAMADRDQALKNVLISAFHNSGQKCSATSLFVLEKELYDDENFKHALKEAVQSLETGSVWDFKNRVGSLSNLPSGNLKKALDYLDGGEEWLVTPSFANDNPYMMKPSVRWGTQRGNFCHMNELFGPVLSVMRAEDLEDAINIVNETGYGLTSGIETLDEREIEYWKENIIAGNLYINRGTTGAIVLRQPFGGMRKSAIGRGKKAGGFNYVSQFMNITCDKTALMNSYSKEYALHIGQSFHGDMPYNDEIEEAIKNASNFHYWYEREFLQEHDYVNIRGESNIIRYLSVKSVLLRLQEDDDLAAVLSTVLAIKMIGARLHISLPKNTRKNEYVWLESQISTLLEKEDVCVREDEAELINSMYTCERIRFLHPTHVTHNIYDSMANSAKYIACTPFVAHGRIELMHYFIEQSVTHTYHRYGNLGLKGLDTKD